MQLCASRLGVDRLRIELVAVRPIGVIATAEQHDVLARLGERARLVVVVQILDLDRLCSAELRDLTQVCLNVCTDMIALPSSHTRQSSNFAMQESVFPRAETTLFMSHLRLIADPPLFVAVVVVELQLLRLFWKNRLIREKVIIGQLTKKGIANTHCR